MYIQDTYTHTQVIYIYICIFFIYIKPVTCRLLFVAWSPLLECLALPTSRPCAPPRACDTGSWSFKAFTMALKQAFSLKNEKKLRNITGCLSPTPPSPVLAPVRSPLEPSPSFQPTASQAFVDGEFAGGLVDDRLGLCHRAVSHIQGMATTK